MIMTAIHPLDAIFNMLPNHQPKAHKPQTHPPTQKDTHPQIK